MHPPHPTLNRCVEQRERKQQQPPSIMDLEVEKKYKVKLKNLNVSLCKRSFKTIIIRLNWAQALELFDPKRFGWTDGQSYR